MRLKLSSIHAMAVHRPQGYVEDVLSRGNVDGDTVTLSVQAYAELCAKYRAPAEARAPLTKAQVGEVIARFEICKACESVMENGHGCAMFHTCCFGKWRANLNNHCPKGSW